MKTLARRLPAGVLDAASASLATFVIGLVAIRLLDASTLGVYALFFAAFRAAVIIPKQLICVPAEVATVHDPEEARLGILPRSVSFAFLGSTLAAGICLIPFLLAPTDVDFSDTKLIFVTVAVATIVSPVQDHIRRLLHMAGQSWGAAIVSVTQLVTVSAAVASLIQLNLPGAAIPFASLALANVVSMGAGLSIAWLRRGSGTHTEVRLRQLLTTGRWLFTAEAVPHGVAFLAAALVATIAGSEALGFAEAARVIAQPIQVLATGLFVVTRPYSMTAGAQGEQSTGARIARIYMALLLASGPLLLLAIGFPWDGNFLVDIVPNAYSVTGLLGVSIMANVVNGISRPWQSELVGGGRETWVARTEAFASLSRLVVAVASGVLRSFAIPLGVLAAGMVRLLLYRQNLRSMYGSRTTQGQGPAERAAESWSGQ